MIPVHVISLKSARERRRNAERQLEAAGVEFRFFDAFEGGHGACCFTSVDTERFLLNTGKLPQPGEIGCYASHLALWRHCIAAKRPILIMEDDFRLTGQFPRALRSVGQLIDEVGYLRLQAERRARSLPVAEFGPFRLERYTKPPHCAMCYAVTPAVATRLVSLSDDFRAPVDVVMKRVWQIGQPLYCLRPYTVIDSALCMASHIGTRRRCPKPASLRLRRTVRKAQRLLRRWHFNLRQSDAPLRQRLRSSTGRSVPGRPDSLP